MWAREAGQTRNYLFAVMDILPNDVGPETVITNLGLGLADHVFTVHKYPVFVPVSFDLSETGSHVGWAWSTGGMLSIPWRDHWHLLPSVRLVHSDLAGSKVQPIFGVMVGWQK